MTFKGFNDSKRLLDCPQNLDMLEGKKMSAMLPSSWKKSFNNGINKPTKMRRCKDCRDGILRTTCRNQVNGNKEFKAILNLIKRKATNQFGHLLPYFVLYDGFLKRIFYLIKFLFNKWMV